MVSCIFRKLTIFTQGFKLNGMELVVASHIILPVRSNKGRSGKLLPHQLWRQLRHLLVGVQGLGTALCRLDASWTAVGSPALELHCLDFSPSPSLASWKLTLLLCKMGRTTAPTRDCYEDHTKYFVNAEAPSPTSSQTLTHNFSLHKLPAFKFSQMQTQGPE